MFLESSKLIETYLTHSSPGCDKEFLQKENWFRILFFLHHFAICLKEHYESILEKTLSRQCSIFISSENVWKPGFLTFSGVVEMKDWHEMG